MDTTQNQVTEASPAERTVIRAICEIVRDAYTPTSLLGNAVPRLDDCHSRAAAAVDCLLMQVAKAGVTLPRSTD